MILRKQEHRCRNDKDHGEHKGDQGDQELLFHRKSSLTPILVFSL
jgi:hypothetical protein